MSPGRKQIPCSSRPHNGKAEIFSRYIGAHYISENKNKKGSKKVFRDFWQGERESIQEICGQNMKQNLKMTL